jgi:hypothetical protein
LQGFDLRRATDLNQVG